MNVPQENSKKKLRQENKYKNLDRRTKVDFYDLVSILQRHT